MTTLSDLHSKLRKFPETAEGRELQGALRDEAARIQAESVAASRAAARAALQDALAAFETDDSPELSTADRARLAAHIRRQEGL